MIFGIICWPTAQTREVLPQPAVTMQRQDARVARVTWSGDGATMWLLYDPENRLHLAYGGGVQSVLIEVREGETFLLCARTGDTEVCLPHVAPRHVYVPWVSRAE